MKATSRGPVFFQQEPRIGRGGQRFTMFKFRTMQSGVDNAIHQQFITQFIKSGASSLTEVEDSPFRLTRDPRITHWVIFCIGAGLDELPQLLNVLSGATCSLVEKTSPPRPRSRAIRPWHCHHVLEAKLPGVTSLGQVEGRSQSDR